MLILSHKMSAKLSALFLTILVEVSLFWGFSLLLKLFISFFIFLMVTSLKQKIQFFSSISNCKNARVIFVFKRAIETGSFVFSIIGSKML